MLVAPVGLLICAFGYLARLYPGAVFLWGDVEDWYKSILRRRNTVWNVVIATLVLGLIANLAVFALGNPIK